MENLKSLQKKVLKTKKDLKEWEAVFAKKHGRPPTVKDVSARPNIEKFYKKYNQLKKELKEETSKQNMVVEEDSQSSLPPVLNDSQPTQERRRSSVEFIRSPSHPMGSRIKPSIFDSKQQVNVRRLSTFEEKKTTTVKTTTTTTTTKKTLTEDEAFWLDLPTATSFSQPVTSTNFSQPSTDIIPQTQPSRLILGSSQPKRKKNLKQQKLFGRNPFQRASSSQDLLHPLEDTLPTPIIPSSPIPSIMSELIPDDDEDDDMVEIVTHEIDPFRKYHPSLFHWEDPTFSIGPGFFNSVSTCFSIPMLNEPKRRDRVLLKLEKGTLGEVLEENESMELDVGEDIQAFISKHVQIDSIEAALQPIDENLLKQPNEFIYKKKPIQKRQTKLHKMRFVDSAR